MTIKHRRLRLKKASLVTKQERMHDLPLSWWPVHLPRMPGALIWPATRSKAAIFSLMHGTFRSRNGLVQRKGSFWHALALK